MRMTASGMIKDPTVFHVGGAKWTQWRAPSDPQQIDRARQTPKICKKPLPMFSALRVLRASRRCRKQKPAKGKPPRYASFRSLDTFRALRGTDRRRRTKTALQVGRGRRAVGRVSDRARFSPRPVARDAISRHCAPPLLHVRLMGPIIPGALSAVVSHSDSVEQS